MAYSILLVEDDEKIREVIRDYFSGKSDEFQIIVAADGTEGKRLISEENFDLILLDVMLPGINGFSLMKELRSSKDTPVIFITAKTREEDRLHGYELGCDDYVCKPFSLAELYAKTWALIKRTKGTVLSDALHCGMITLERRSLKVSAGGEEISLAPKELELLAALMSRPGWVFTRDMLLDQVWGMDYDGTDRTVDNHIKKLRRDLGQAGGQIKTVFSKGYKICDR